MPSVIHSARTSTASVFDFVGTTATVANQLIRTSARAVDALDSKAELMHKRVTTNTRAQLVNVANREIVNAAVEHADFMRDIYQRQNPHQEFDWNECYNSAIREISAAVNDG